MKILDKAEPWPDKVNFVDENEVHLGYDTSDDCCAWGGWFLSDDKDFWPAGEWLKEPDRKTIDLPGWTFDTSYFVEREMPAPQGDGMAVQFRITDGKGEKFITLYNCHNGYYSKGFEFTVPADPLKSRNGGV